MRACITKSITTLVITFAILVITFTILVITITILMTVIAIIFVRPVTTLWCPGCPKSPVPPR